MGSNGTGTSTVLVEVEQDLPEHFIPVSTGPGCFIRCCFWTIVAVFYVFLPGTFILISYLRDPDRLWRPQRPEFRIQSATLYPLNSSSTNFTGTWDLKLVAINPNEKLGIYYDTLEAWLLCSVEDLPSVLASTSLPPFFLTRRNQTSFSLILPVVGGYVGDDADRTALSLRWGLRVLLCYRYKTTVSELKDPKFVVLSLSFPQVENGQGSIQNSTKT